MMVGGGMGGTSEPGWTLEQAFTQIQQLLNVVNTLQQTIAQQDQTIAQLQAQNTATPPAQNQTACSPKMATPPLYDGSMAQCEAFINACHLYISAKPHEFTSLQTKITWVLGFMQSGMAQLFRDHFMDIYKAFGDPNKQATAIQEITMIKQGQRTGEEHVQAFKQCYMQSGYGETTGIHEFKRSLNTPLLDKIMGIPELPTSLDKWYDLAIWLDRQWRQAVAEKKIFASRSGKGEQGTSNSNRQPLAPNPQHQTPRQPALPATQPRHTHDPNAMDIDHNRSQKRCFNCGQTGHFA
ncbi:hypothetical protein AMATHDRAFT_10856 [Amanita thiersii Skay4041]|uniref:CCHC-type domain-containing protein n=1 Tax=Amanita thiersii Skay4041 TaxID=703135 RepID=A0A2A9N7L1_9AGAR|nr:hypothetical protein AMATHDRAFT_10856 [Amanita thiersii Skay4041]